MVGIEPSVSPGPEPGARSELQFFGPVSLDLLHQRFRQRHVIERLRLCVAVGTAQRKKARASFERAASFGLRCIRMKLVAAIGHEFAPRSIGHHQKKSFDFAQWHGGGRLEGFVAGQHEVAGSVL